MTESGIHHFATQAKIASISEQTVVIMSVSALSASCLGGLVLSASKKKVFLVYRKIFRLVDPVQHQYVFSKGLLSEFC